MMHCAYNVKM
jgi:hypothetical protein